MSSNEFVYQMYKVRMAYPPDRVVLDDIPPRYLGEEVTRFLLTEMATCYADSLVADPGNTDDERDLHDVRREIARLSEPKTVPDWLPTCAHAAR